MYLFKVVIFKEVLYKCVLSVDTYVVCNVLCLICKGFMSFSYLLFTEQNGNVNLMQINRLYVLVNASVIYPHPLRLCACCKNTISECKQ